MSPYRFVQFIEQRLKQTTRLSRPLWCVSCLLLAAGCDNTPAIADAWGSLTPGPFTVGFRQIPATPTSPVEALVWYPSRQDGTTYLGPTDYAQLLEQPGNGQTSVPTTDSVLAELFIGSGGSAARGAIPPLLAVLGKAERDLAPLTDARPLAIWSARHDAGIYQFVLSEFLASHGMVVASSRRRSDHLPPPWSTSETEKPAVLSQHVADLHTVYSLLDAQHFVDGNTVAVLAWSYGGESALRFIAEHPTVRSVVDLSSTMFSGWLYEPAARNEFPWTAFSVPVLQVIEGIRMDGTRKPIAATTNEWGAPVQTFRFPDLKHGNFNTLEGFLPTLTGADSEFEWVVNHPHAQPGYEVTVQLIKGFLMLTTGGDPPSESLDVLWADELASGLMEQVP